MKGRLKRTAYSFNYLENFGMAAGGNGVIIAYVDYVLINDTGLLLAILMPVMIC